MLQNLEMTKSDASQFMNRRKQRNQPFQILYLIKQLMFEDLQKFFTY